MSSDTPHERFTSGNHELLADSVWDDDPETCRACGATRESADLRCHRCGAIVPVCVGACGACYSPVCVGKR